ncbi:MAG: metallophosphoesterase [Halieaceae bacterium]|jgi:3',5'-cyclic AMP phosphodiesterase CpdA|nr:metallophosphoesterase [Halieaceae bacterium]
MTHRFAHLSDPHLSTLDGVPLSRLLGKRFLSYLSWRRKRRLEHRAEVLDALLEDLADGGCSQILVSGDLTHTGLPEEFIEARNWLQRLGPPEQVAVIPGNHDSLVETPWEQTYAHWAPYIASDADQPPTGGYWPSLRLRGPLAFIGLSSALPTPPLMASGEIDRAQLDALARLLEQQRQRCRIIFLHHSPVDGAEKWRKRLRNAAALREVIAEHGAELVLHGHGHRQRWSQIPGRDGDVPVLAVPSASARGLYGADVAAYNLCSISQAPGGWSLQVETRRLDNAQNKFNGDESREIWLARSL